MDVHDEAREGAFNRKSSMHRRWTSAAPERYAEHARTHPKVTGCVPRDETRCVPAILLCFQVLRQLPMHQCDATDPAVLLIFSDDLLEILGQARDPQVSEIRLSLNVGSTEPFGLRYRQSNRI